MIDEGDPVWSASLPSTLRQVRRCRSDAKNTPEIIPKRWRHQLLREHDDRRGRRREDEADEDVSTALAARRHRAAQRERQRAEDREPDDVFAAEAIAERPPKNAPAALAARKMKRYSWAAWSRLETCRSDRRCNSSTGSTRRAA